MGLASLKRVFSNFCAAISRRPEVVLALVFVVVVFFLTYGFDRLPLLSGSDDVSTADAALEYSAGGAFRAQAYDGTPMGKLFSIYPPLWVLMQACVFKVMEFSSLSMRLLDLVAGTLGFFFFVQIMHKLWLVGRVGTAELLLGGTAYLLEPGSFLSIRIGRVEPLGLAFSGAAFAILFSWLLSPHKVRKNWLWVAHLCMGLAMSVHWTFFAVNLNYLCLLAFGLSTRRLQNKNFLMGALVPPAVAVGIWVATFRNASLDALYVFHAHTSQFLVISKSWIFAIAPLLSGDLFQFFKGPGLMVIWAIFSIFFVFLTWVSNLPHKGINRIDGLNKYVFVANLLLILSLYFIFGISRTRLYPMIPLFIISSCLSIRAMKESFRRPALAMMAVLCLGSAVSFAFLAKKIQLEYSMRDPDRFKSIVREIKTQGARSVLCDYAFWFAFVKEGIKPKVWDAGFIFNVNYWQSVSQENLDSFDAIVLRTQSSLNSRINLSKFSKRELSDFSGQYSVYTRF